MYSSESYNCVQQIDISGCSRVLGLRNSVLVATDHDMWALSAVGVLEQVKCQWVLGTGFIHLDAMARLKSWFS